MEKTLTINISGWVFNINEDAYEKLTQYFKMLKKHFQKEEGGDEIVTDIESRIAELFKERITDQNAVVLISHVDEIIGIMGQPFEMEEDQDEDTYSYSVPKGKGSKTLFRDTINGHIAGVASGLGKYVNLDPIFIRIAFLLLIPTGGLGIILYLVLWILIPEAKSTSDRIRMEGKKVNIKNIETKVREETDYLKDRLNDFSEEAIGVYKKTGPARRQGLKSIEGFVKSFGKFLLRVLKILLGFVLFIYGVGLLVGFAIVQFNWIPSLEFDVFSIHGMSLPSFLNTYVMENSYGLVAVIALSLVVFIPIIMMIFHGIRFLFNLKRNKTVGTIAWQSWIVALIIAFGIGYTTITAFKDESFVITKHDFKALKSDTLQIKLNTANYYANVLSSDRSTVISQDRSIPILHDGEFYGEPRLRIINSDKNEFYMKLYQSSRGHNETRADENIQDIEFSFSIDSSGIILDPYYLLKKEAKWRAQDVDIRIYVPEGKTIMIDRNIRRHFRLSYFWSHNLWGKDNEVTYWVNKDGEFDEPNLEEDDESEIFEEEFEEETNDEEFEEDKDKND